MKLLALLVLAGLTSGCHRWATHYLPIRSSPQGAEVVIEGPEGSRVLGTTPIDLFLMSQSYYLFDGGHTCPYDLTLTASLKQPPGWTVESIRLDHDKPLPEEIVFDHENNRMTLREELEAKVQGQFEPTKIWYIPRNGSTRTSDHWRCSFCETCEPRALSVVGD